MTLRPVLAMAAFVAACAPSSEDAGTTRSSIVFGTESTEDDDAAVLVMHYDALRTGGDTSSCTGVMLAPTLVLTARHCVAITDESASCSATGANVGGEVHENRVASTLYVFAGRERPNFLAGNPPVARGTAILDDGAKTICGHDIALLVLDRPLSTAKLAPVRLDEPPVKGERVTLVGWGLTEEDKLPTTRRRRGDVEILSIESAEFRVGQGGCKGDSGGPAFAESGAVLGVLSRGLPDCVKDGENVYSSANAHADFILSGYERVGAQPWREGEPQPTTEVESPPEEDSGCAVVARGRTSPIGMVLAVFAVGIARLRRRHSGQSDPSESSIASNGSARTGFSSP